MKIGALNITDIKLGTNQIQKIMNGEILIWQIGGAGEDWPAYYFTISDGQTIKKYDSDGDLVAESASIGWVPSTIIADDTYIYVGWSSNIKKYDISNLGLIASGLTGGSPTSTNYDVHLRMSKHATQNVDYLFISNGYEDVTKIQKSNLARIWRYSVSEWLEDETYYYSNIMKIYSITLLDHQNKLLLFGEWSNETYDLEYNLIEDSYYTYNHATIMEISSAAVPYKHDHLREGAFAEYYDHSFYRLLDEDNAIFYVAEHLNTSLRIVAISKDLMADFGYSTTAFEYQVELAATVDKEYLYYFKKATVSYPLHTFVKIRKDSMYATASPAAFAVDAVDTAPYLLDPMSFLQHMNQNQDYLFLTYFGGSYPNYSGKSYKYAKSNFGYHGTVPAHGNLIKNLINQPAVNTQKILNSSNKLIMVGSSALGYVYSGEIPALTNNTIGYGCALVADTTHLFLYDHTSSLLKKYALSDLHTHSLIASVNIGSDAHRSADLIIDDTYIYVAHNGKQLRKYLKSDLSYVAGGPTNTFNSHGTVLIGDYVYFSTGNVVYKHNKSTLAVIEGINLGGNYSQILVDPSNSQYIYALRDGNILYKIDTATMALAEPAVTLSIPLSTHFSTTQFLVDKNYIYVTHSKGLFVYDKTASHALYKKIPIGGNALKIRKIGNYIYLGVSGASRSVLTQSIRDGVLQIFNAADLKIIREIYINKIILDFIIV